MSNTKSQIRVVTRVRPYTVTEKEQLDSSNLPKSVFEFINRQSCSVGAHTFNFDRVFTPEADQEEVFHTHFNEDVDNLLDGCNSAIIAFGQTAAGKSFTMTGGISPTTEGIIPRAARRIFENYNGAITASYIEIYKDKLQDLLNQKAPVTMFGDGTLKDVKEIQALSAIELLKSIARGNLLRSTATTNMNSASSRSHAVLILQLENGAKLKLIDLAGSEVARKTGATAELLGEAASINKSLTNLAMVISALSQPIRPKHIPYRGSKLTQMLQDILGGGSKTTLIINCSPSSVHLAETISSLRFGVRAKMIVSQQVPDKEERALYATLTSWGDKIDQEYRYWQLRGSQNSSEWLEFDQLISLLELPKSTNDLLLEYRTSVERLRGSSGNGDQATVPSNEHTNSELIELDEILAKHRETISSLNSELEGVHSRMREFSSITELPTVVTPEVFRVDELNKAIASQRTRNEELRIELVKLRTQPLCEKVNCHLRQLEFEIIKCSDQIESLSTSKRPSHGDKGEQKRMKFASPTTI